MTTALTIVKDDLQALAARINDEYGLAERDRKVATEHAQTAMEHALATGRLLIEAKSKVKHGEWIPWLESNTNVPERTAQKWMRLAQNRPEADLGVNEALRLLAEPKKRQADGREADVPSVPEALASHVDETAADAPDLPSHPAALRLVPPVVEHEAAMPVASGEGDASKVQLTDEEIAEPERFNDGTYRMEHEQRYNEIIGLPTVVKMAFYGFSTLRELDAKDVVVHADDEVKELLDNIDEDISRLKEIKEAYRQWREIKASKAERDATPAEETSTEQAEEQPARDADADGREADVPSVPDGDDTTGTAPSGLSQQADEVINQAWPEAKVPYRARMQSAVALVLAAGAKHPRLVAMLGKKNPYHFNALASLRDRREPATMRMACVILNHYNGRRESQNSAYIQQSALLAVASSTAATSQPAQ